MPQVVIGRDDLGGRHGGGVDVGDVPLQPGQLAGAIQPGLVKGPLAAGVLHEPRGLGLLLPGDDLPGAVLLDGECLVVTRGALG